MTASWDEGIRTMVPAIRILNLIRCCENAPEGDFVECGVWRGGCLAVMAKIANEGKLERKVYGYDSFEGLPEQSAKDNGHGSEYVGDCVASENDVWKTFDEWRVTKTNTTLFSGWFKDTLPKTVSRIDKISVLRIDGDWYESTKNCLEYFYDKVCEGGYIIIDDYNTWSGCKNAVDEFINERHLNVDLSFTDQNGEAWFKKHINRVRAGFSPALPTPPRLAGPHRAVHRKF